MSRKMNFGLAGVVFPVEHQKLPSLSTTYREFKILQPTYIEKYLCMAEELKIAVLITKALQNGISYSELEVDVSMMVGDYLRDIFWLCNMSTVENAFFE